MPSLDLDPNSTALILIDLQQGVVTRPLAPRPAAEVVRTCATLAAACRDRGVPVVYVRVDVTNFQRLPVDQPAFDPKAPPPPPSASELVPEAGRQSTDPLVTKRQWDAFHGGTGLEQLLRDRGARTVLLGGIATNFGVESTARTANALGFAVVLVEDATATFSAEAHQFALSTIFPRLGRVRQSADVLAALGAA